VFALTLGTTGISVEFNFLGRDFYNALAGMIWCSCSSNDIFRLLANTFWGSSLLQDKDQEKFTQQLLYYLGAFAGGIPVSILLLFCRYCSSCC